MKPRLAATLAALLLLGPGKACAGSIDTAFLEQPWKHQHDHDYEVGKHAVHWRERGSRKDGIFSGMRFTVPLDRKRTWQLANEYTDVGAGTEGIKSVTIVEQTPSRQVIRVEAEVLWITLVLNFEVEQDEQEIVRFRLSNSGIGEYRGYCRFRDAIKEGALGAGTEMEFATWFKSARPIPTGLALLAERMVLLRGARSFLRTCETEAAEQSHLLK